MLTVKLETDNAAFGDTAEEALAESARILRVAAGAMDCGTMSGKLRDVNGHTVGRWDLTAD